MRILITGGTGYLGSNLVKTFLQHGYELACLVRNTSQLARLEESKNGVHLIQIDEMAAGIEKFNPDIVVHTACAYSRRNMSQEDVLRGNLLFPLEVLRIVCKMGKKRWINTATCLPPDLNTYTLSKHQFVQWGRFYAQEGQIKFVNLELEHFYGPNAPEHNFIAWVVQKLKENRPLELTNGTQKRDFIYIDDVLRIYDGILNISFPENYTEIPVGTGTAPEIREVILYLAQITHSNSLLQFGAVPSRKFEPNSNCNLEQLKRLSLVPKFSWQEGMRHYCVDL